MAEAHYSDPPGDLNGRLTTTEVARILRVNEAYVRKLASIGVLTDVITSRLGRLYNPEEVELLRQAREEERTAKARS